MKTDKFTIDLKNGEAPLKIKLENVRGGGEGTKDYEKLINKPRIEGEELIGDKSFEDLHMHVLTNLEIETLLN
jgi:hypothetical protein